MAKPIAVTDNTFKKEVLDSELPVLVDFWAAWCGPCLMIAPILEQVAEEKKGTLKITKLDVDRNHKTSYEHSVRSIPTLILFKGGKPVERIIGYMPKSRLMEKLQPHLN